MRMSEQAAVVLTYNSEHIVASCLDALRKQEGWRIVVADNNSHDNTATVVRSQYPEATFIQHADNHGYAGGYNRALCLLEDEGVQQAALINPDAVVQPHCLDTMAKTLTADPQAVAVTPLVRTPTGVVDNAGGEMDWEHFRPVYYGREDNHKELLRQRRPVELATGACMLLRLSAYQDIGPMEESFFLYWEETDFCLRALKRGYRIWYEPDAEVVHAKRSSSSSMTDAETTYYYTRNSLYCAERTKGKEYVNAQIARFAINQLGYQLHRQDTQFSDEFLSIMRGIKDYQSGHTGIRSANDTLTTRLLAPIDRHKDKGVGAI